MTATLSTRSTGFGRVLIAVYGLLALAATGRSVYQILDEFEVAPLAYSLSALASVVYIVATVALIVPGPVWEKIAWATMSFELVGVLVVGTLSVFDPELFPAKTVWSLFGRGYGFVPLVLPVVGLIWLMLQRRRAQTATALGNTTATGLGNTTPHAAPYAAPHAVPPTAPTEGAL